MGNTEQLKKMQQIAREIKATDKNIKHRDAVKKAWVILRGERTTEKKDSSDERINEDKEKRDSINERINEDKIELKF